MENNVVLNRRKKAKEKILFIILCIVIALIVIGNILAITLAYFTDRKSGSASIRTGTIKVIGYVYSEEDEEYTTDILTLENDIVYPGSLTTQKIKLVNNGTGAFYIRMNCAMELNLNGSYQPSSFLEISSISLPSGVTGSFIKSTDDGKYYYTGSLAKNSYIEDIEVTFRVKPELGNNDLANTIGYQNIPYKMFLDIEVIQTNSITLDTTSADTIADNWP